MSRRRRQQLKRARRWQLEVRDTLFGWESFLVAQRYREAQGLPLSKSREPHVRNSKMSEKSEFTAGPLTIDCLHSLGIDGVCRHCGRNILGEAAEATAAKLEPQ